MYEEFSNTRIDRTFGVFLVFFSPLVLSLVCLTHDVTYGLFKVVFLLSLGFPLSILFFEETRDSYCRSVCFGSFLVSCFGGMGAVAGIVPGITVKVHRAYPCRRVPLTSNYT